MKPSDLERYDWDYTEDYMTRSEHGDYYQVSDVDPVLAQKDAEIAELNGKLDWWRKTPAEVGELKGMVHALEIELSAADKVVAAKDAEIERLKKCLLAPLFQDKQRISTLEAENARLKKLDENPLSLIGKINKLEAENARLNELLRLEFRPE